MFHRYLLLFVVASLTVSGRTAWAFDVFVDVNAKNASTTADLQAYPTGVSPGGACVLQGATASNASYYDVCYYPGGPAGAMTNIDAAFNYSSARFGRAMGDAMNDHGDFTSNVFVATPQAQWLTTNGGTNTTYNANVPSGNGQQIRGIGIDENDDICGVYTGRSTTYGVPYVSINNGGGSFTTYTLTQARTLGRAQ